jgi:hypothetical protein
VPALRKFIAVMKRTTFVAAVLAMVLTSCGDSPDVAAEKAFRGYHEALLARDFPTACSYNTPDSTAKLLASVRTQAIAATTCEDAFAAIYSESGPAATADGVSTSVQIQNVAVTGDFATIRWTAQLDGQQRPASTTMRRVDGHWLLVAGE